MCAQGVRGIGPFVSEQFVEIVKQRNKLARLLGFEDFYDYKVGGGAGRGGGQEWQDGEESVVGGEGSGISRPCKTGSGPFLPSEVEHEKECGRRNGGFSEVGAQPHIQYTTLPPSSILLHPPPPSSTLPPSCSSSQVTAAEGFGKTRLFEILDDLEAKTRPIMAAARQRLAQDKGAAALEPWNMSYALAGEGGRGGEGRGAEGRGGEGRRGEGRGGERDGD